jgi:hypothetical protein
MGEVWRGWERGSCVPGQEVWWDGDAAGIVAAAHQDANHSGSPPRRRRHEWRKVRSLSRPLVWFGTNTEHLPYVVREPALSRLGEGVLSGAIGERYAHAQGQHDAV